MNKLDYICAPIQFVGLFLLTLIGMVAGLFLVPVGILFMQKDNTNKFGERTFRHSQKYREQGSSGYWEYWEFPKILWPWSNDEDGALGEPSGKHSARVGGKERSFGAIYQWMALRNPFNNTKRYTALFACKPEECKIEWIGDGNKVSGRVELDDGEPLKEGWYFLKAYKSWWPYYSFRLVKRRKNGKIIHIRLGYKVKPRHIGKTFDADDKTKGFTFRITFWANEN